MSVLLLAGYIPLALVIIALGVWSSGLRRDSEAARVLGDQLGRRTGTDRRSSDAVAFVGSDRRSGAERRGAQDARADRAA